MFEDGKITVTRFAGIALTKVTSVSIVNDQIVINGNNLNAVTGVRITGPSSFDKSFSIESKSSNSLIANGLSNVAFTMNGLFNLVLSDAEAAATFQVTFTLQDGAVTASKLDDMGAGVGQVLKFDGTNWGPSDLGALTYAGTWDSSTGIAPNVSPTPGEYYIVSVADTGIDIGDGSGTRNFAVGDWLVYNDLTSMWDKIDNGTNVTSFNGRNGVVVPTAGDYTWAQINKTSSVLSEIADIDAPTGDGSDTGKVLKWNNATSRWELGDDITSGGAGSVTSSEISDGTIVDDDINGAAAINQSKIANLTTDLASKVPLAGGTMTGDLTVPNLVTAGNVDGVDVSTLATSVGTNATNIGNNTTAIGNNATAISALDTDDVSEGTALYFTDARAKSSAVVNSTAGSETDQAASVAAMKSYVAANGSLGSLILDGTVAMLGDLDLGNNKLKLKSNNANYVEMIAPDALGATYTLTMPANDGANGQVLSTDGSGVLSWTTTTSGTVTNVTGTAPIVSSGGATPALSIAQANGATDGYLDSADWTTFNNKQAAITTGTTAQYLRGDLTLSSLQGDVRSTLLTGFSSGAGAVAATDTILQAINKLDGNIAANGAAVSGLDTDDVSEGTALYFTDARARSAAVLNSTAGTQTNQAASVNAMKSYVTTAISGFGGGDFLADGTITMTGDLDLGNNKVLLGSSNANNVELIAPNALGATYTLTMPANDGTNGQVLRTNGSGVLSWTTTSSGTVTNVTGTAPIVSSGGATPALSMAQANGATDGYLDSADWTTFNNKQAAITTGSTSQYLRGDLTLSSLQGDVRSTLLTGFSSGAGAVAATDTILQAINKLDGNIAANGAAVSGLDTDDVSEGSALYFTDARARSAAVVNSTAGAQTNQAASVAAMKTYVAANAGAGDFLSNGTVTMTGDFDLGNNKVLLGSTNTNNVELIAPNALGATYTLTMPADDGTNGQVLRTNGSGVLSWVSTATGTVTNVTGTAPIVSSGGATPAISMAQANGATDGYLDSADWTTFNNKQAAITTGATSQYLRGDLTLSSLQGDVRSTLLTGFSSGAGAVAATDTILQAINKLDGNINGREPAFASAATTTYLRGDKTFVTLDTSVVAENTNLYHTTARARTAAVINSTAGTETNQAASVAAMKSYVAANAGNITDGGNTEGSAISIGTNDAQSLQLETNNNTALTILSDGNVGIGETSPSAKLVVNGAAINDGATADTDRVIDFSTSNLAYTTSSCGSFTLQNMLNGGSYTLAVQGSSTNTCSFTAAGYTIHLPTDHTSTTISTHTLYTFLVMGTHVYVAWVPGL